MKALVGEFQPGEGPSRGLLRDCTTSPINRFAALLSGLTEDDEPPSSQHLTPPPPRQGTIFSTFGPMASSFSFHVWCFNIMFHVSRAAHKKLKWC